MKLGLIIALSLAGGATAIGVPTGIYLANSLKEPTIDYSAIETDGYNYDMAAGRAKYAACSGDYSTLAPEDAFNISLDLLNGIEHYRTQGIGEAKALFITQEIRSTIVRDGDRYFEESLSASNSSLSPSCAWRMYQDEEGVSQYQGSMQSGSYEAASFNEDEGLEFNYDAYRDRMGRLISDRSIFVVSSSTVIAEESSFAKEGNGYQLKITLDPVLSVVNYVKQMVTVSNLPSAPTFNSLSIEMTLDEKLYPVTLTTEESYQADSGMGIQATVNGSVTTYYDLDGEFSIPSLNEPEIYDAR